MEALKELASKLNGVQYLEIPEELIKFAKENGIVIVSGQSDDLCELEGAINDEFGCYDGGTAYLDEKGVVGVEGDKYITAKWCEEGEDGFTWTYETNIPHEDFEIFDEEEKYCRGFVFYLKDLKPRNSEFLRLVRENPDLPILPCVRSEVVSGDDYNWWLGSFGEARLGKIVWFSMRGEDRLFTDDEQDDIEEYIADEMCEDEANEHLTDEEIDRIAHERAEALPWVKAILVYVDLPDYV